MGVNKFNLNEQLYLRICEWIKEYEKTPRKVNNQQLIQLHALSTEAGFPSRPSGCGSCNLRALDNLYNYKRTYEKE